MSRMILVATDGTPAAMGALWVANALAESHNCQVEVLGVVEPVPVFDAGFLVALPELELYESRLDALKREIHAQVSKVRGGGPSWAISVDSGTPGPRIVRRAEESGADTIIMGLGRHRPVDRVFGTETALQVIRISHIPVLAVPETLTELPRSAVLGVDFSIFSHRAARATASVMQPPWEIHLAHVLSGMEFLPTASEAWREDYEEELRQRLSGLGEEIPTPAGSQLHFHILEGEPSHQLLSFCESKGTGMLVAGSHGHSFVGRLLMGSVSTRLIRRAGVPVLVVPPTDRTEEGLAGLKPGEDVHDWARELQDFTKANAGRRTTLELDDPQLGIQECGVGFPLWGVDYDSRQDRLDIMLGRSGTVEGHLTHSIPAPQEVRVLKREDGRTDGLHVGLRNGTVILRIHRD